MYERFHIFKKITDIQQVSRNYYVLSPTLSIGLGSRWGAQRTLVLPSKSLIHTVRQHSNFQNIRGRQSRIHGQTSGTDTQWHRSSEGTETAVVRGPRGPSQRQEVSSDEPREGEDLVESRRCRGALLPEARVTTTEHLTLETSVNLTRTFASVHGVACSRQPTKSFLF